jgi:hypothetical protein
MRDANLKTSSEKITFLLHACVNEIEIVLNGCLHLLSILFGAHFEFERFLCDREHAASSFNVLTEDSAKITSR